MRNYIAGHFKTLNLVLVLLIGCSTTPTVDHILYNCESYGVMENKKPMGTKIYLLPLSEDELQVKCSGVDISTAATNTKIKGCSIPHNTGYVEAYYVIGDDCAMHHEMCHTVHGVTHTDRYENELKSGILRPYCPYNQLNPHK